MKKANIKIFKHFLCVYVCVCVKAELQICKEL